MAVFPLFALLACGGIVSLINGSLPTDQTVVYRGRITNLFMSGGRHKECQVTISDEATSQEVTLGVSRAEYSTLTVGQIYFRELRVGLVGIPFRPMKDRRLRVEKDE
jgi:hypothetical protein